jgi:hypothetical protein
MVPARTLLGRTPVLADERASSRQVALVVLCLVAVVVAALAMPGVAGYGDGDGPGDGPGTDGDPSGEPSIDDGDGPSIRIPNILRWLFDDEPDVQESRFRVRITPDPVPGREVTATVLENGRPVPDVIVYFNDRRIGRTNDSGQVRGSVPYESELRIRITVPADSDASRRQVSQRSTNQVGHSAPARGRLASTSLSAGATQASLAGTVPTQASLDSAGPNAVIDDGPPRQQDGDQGTNVTDTRPLPTGATLHISGSQRPGATVTMRATVAGDPLANATVRGDDEQVATTDAEGIARVTLPDDGTTQYRITVQRGAVGGSTLLNVEVLGVEVAAATVLPVVATDATVTVRSGVQPLDGVDVRQDGEVIGTTDENGTVGTEFPVAGQTTVSVSAIGQTASTTVEYLFVTSAIAALAALVAGLVALALVVGLLVWLARGVWRAVRGSDVDHHTPGSLLAWLGERLRAAVFRAAGLVQAWATAGWTLLADLAGGLRRLGLSARAWAGALRDTLGRVPPWVRTHLLRPRAAIAFLVTVPALVWHAVTWAPRRVLTWYRGEEPAAEMAAGGDAGAGSTVGTRSLRALWRAFARRIRREDWDRRTPGEIAREAVARGYPRRPVYVLTETFRAVEYGEATLTEALVERAREALDSLDGPDGLDGLDDGGARPAEEGGE